MLVSEGLIIGSQVNLSGLRSHTGPGPGCRCGLSGSVTQQQPGSGLMSMAPVAAGVIGTIRIEIQGPCGASPVPHWPGDSWRAPHWSG